MLTLDLTTLPVLTTDRLVLRELRAEDAPALFAMRSDPIAMELVRRPLATTMEHAHTLIAMIRGIQDTNDGAQWAITLKASPSRPAYRTGRSIGSDHTFIGLVGLWRIMKEHHRAELGYSLAREHWGQGIITEAIPPVLDHGFRMFGCHSVEAITDPRNAASMRVLEKTGFVREAHFKENFLWKGVFTDSVVFSKLAPH